MWSKELLEKFDAALQEVRLAEGYTKERAVVEFLDAAARMAVWRCKANPDHLEGAYFWPFTPIGHLSFNAMSVGILSMTIGGDTWRDALDLLKVFIREHAANVCNKYANDPLPYPHEL